MKKTTIGGQALIEGILMRGPEKTVIAVRQSDGEIVLKEDTTETISKKSKFFRLPFIRGFVGLIDSLRIGSSALTYSASFMEEDEIEEEEEKNGILDRVLGDKKDKLIEFVTMVSSFLFAILLFFFIPTILSSFFKSRISSSFGLNLMEGLARIIVFLVYIVSMSKIPEMKRVFEYHGAEHKSIFCYEKGLDLTVENVRKQSRLHPRCGTSFIFSVMIVSIIILSFFGWPNPLLRLLIRILMLPVIMGVTYEINRFLARRDGIISDIFTYPGLLIQKLATVKEPDDGQIEVAIAALKEVIPEDEELDVW